MSNIKIAITENGTTTLATAGKYCDRNVDVEVNVAGSGGDCNGFHIPEEVFSVTGNGYNRFGNGTLDWLINLYGNHINTYDITNGTYMFSQCGVEYIPFSINFKEGQAADISSMFAQANNLKELPRINNLKPSAMSQAFYRCFSIREIPDDYGDNWDLEYFNTSTGTAAYFLGDCYSLRRVPRWHENVWSKANASYSSAYNNRYSGCYVLDKVDNIPVIPATFTSNVFGNICKNNYRLQEFMFMTNEDGTPKTASWKSQTIDLASSSIGYVEKYYISYITTDYNSGITADKQVTDDATYQALKNNPDWWTTDINYSRYNHDSAVNTINSLPDCSATGINTIKFKGASGALTDGGAINTLTEAEIAVATAKGWTVTLS